MKKCDLRRLIANRIEQESRALVLGESSERPPPEPVLCGRMAIDLEYVAVVLRQRAVRWFVLQEGTYKEVEADEAGIIRSAVFPGLWLDVKALLRLNGLQGMDILRQGPATSEHATFVRQLQERRQTE